MRSWLDDGGRKVYHRKSTVSFVLKGNYNRVLNIPHHPANTKKYENRKKMGNA